MRAAVASRQARRQVPVKAVHLVRAGAPEATRALVDAAKIAEASFDDPAASEFLQAALAQAAGLPESDRRVLEAEIGVLSCRVMRGEDFTEQSIGLIERLLRRGSNGDAEPRLLAGLGKQLRRRGKLDQAATALKRAIQPMLALGDRAGLLGIYRDLGRVHVARRDPEGAIRELSEGLDLVTLGEGPRAAIDVDLWGYLHEISEVHRSAGQLAEARRWCELALYQAESRSNRLGNLRCHTQMAWVLRDLKQVALAEQHLARALEEARHFGDRLTTAELLIERARARAARGKLAEATRCCEEALRLARGLQWAEGIDHAERAIAMLKRQAPQAPANGPEPSDGFPRPDLDRN
jgi:tetratricopeptide (TPR) repeat protein